MSIVVSTLGFPRIGPDRELKRSLERFWAGKTDAAALLSETRALRALAWERQRRAGVTHVPSNDFSLYDHVLDTSVMVGAIPPIYGWQGGDVSLDTVFAMARGTHTSPAGSGEGSADADPGRTPAEPGVPALEMTKWFDTNYHYLVPEFSPGQEFTLASTKPIDELEEARRLGIRTRPVLLGPVTYLLLGKSPDRELDPLSLLPGLLPVYVEVLRRLAAAGAEWVQIDEPALVLDLGPAAHAAFRSAYATLRAAVSGVKLLVATYYGALGDNLDTALALPVHGVHVDLVRAPRQLDRVLDRAPPELGLSLGVVDGRNVWRTDLEAVLDRLEPVAASRGTERMMLGPSCPLLHVPVDLDAETDLDPELKRWLAFAVQKVGELVTLGAALDRGRAAVRDELAESAEAVRSRRSASRIHDPAVRARAASVSPDMLRRGSAFSDRRPLQRERLRLPAFPATTIGSFPQSREVRQARARYRRGGSSEAEYAAFLRQEIESAIRWQERVGLDVLVHGEFERTDMVEHFGERLTGFAVTRHGWVQSYGSRCVRPPILFGDVSRPHPMTTEWSSYAQSLTPRPVKAMLTGPITILQWSFVRDDRPREEVARQIALALRDEVRDLEEAGIRVIQIDEPALREGLPLRQADRREYLDWAVASFRLASSGVANGIQIHTHMCYSEFDDIMAAIVALDADVLSIETARSRMDLLDAFVTHAYPNEIGPGVYDIHSPRRPGVEEIVAMLEKACEHLPADRIWVNPDCGLKTRTWDEVGPALANMVSAAQRLRERYLVNAEG